jgi:hypothetical protein
LAQKQTLEALEAQKPYTYITSALAEVNLVGPSETLKKHNQNNVFFQIFFCYSKIYYLLAFKYKMAD